MSIKPGMLGLVAMIALAAPAGMAQQVQRGVISGVVVRQGTSQPVTDAQVTLVPAQSLPILDAIMNAAGTLAGQAPAMFQSAAPQWLTLPSSELKATLEGRQRTSLPAALVNAMNQLQAVRDSVPGLPRTTSSDNSGRFTFNEVPPGNYAVMARRDGFFGKAADGPARVFPYAYANVSVTGTRSPDVSIVMAAGAAITGHIQDEKGSPLIGVTVQAFNTTYQGGLPTLLEVVSNTTDDRGEYRLFYMQPGEYLVAVTPPSKPSAGPSSPGEVYVKTYYPGVVEAVRAIPVAVTIGNDSAGIDMTLQKVRPAKISGRVLNELPPVESPDGTASELPPAGIILLQRDNAVPDDFGARIIANIPLKGSSTAFEVSGILPGVYDLYARQAHPKGSFGQNGQTLAFGRLPIEIRDRDLTDVTLVLHASVDVKGTVALSGATAEASLRVGLQPDGSSAKIPNYRGVVGRLQTPARDGSFTVPAVAEGNYRILVEGLPPDAYVDDVRQRAQSVYDSGIFIDAKPPEPLQVLVSGNGGMVEGTVSSTGDRKPFPLGSVVLIPEGAHRQNTGLYKTATSDPQGHFLIRGIRPGTYRVIAWESVLSDAYKNPAFLYMYEARGSIVNVTPSSSSKVELTVIPKD